MEQVNINELVPDRDYYIQYEGLDQDEYITNGKFTRVRKLGTFKRLNNVYGFGNLAHFINIRDVNTGKLNNEYPFPQRIMPLSSPPYYFYKVPSQIILQKIMDKRTNLYDVGNYSKGFLGGKKSRKNKKSKKRSKSIKNKKLKK